MALEQVLLASFNLYEREKFEIVRQFSQELWDLLTSQAWPHIEVAMPIAVWRRAYQIHHWFVQNCQDGVDDGRRTLVGREQLEELLDLCDLVLEEPDKAAEVLPVVKGREQLLNPYGDIYFEQVRDTVKVLERALQLPRKVWFWYESYRSRL